MDIVDTVEVKLTPELAQFVHTHMEQGDFSSEAEVVRDALRQAAQHEQALANVRQKIAIGMASLRAGRSSDGGAFMAALDAELAELERAGH